MDARLIMSEYKIEIRNLRKVLAENISNLILGEKLPLDITNEETGEVIVAAGKRVNKQTILKIVLACPNVDIYPSPLRVGIMRVLYPYDQKVKEIEAELAKKLKKLEESA